MYVCQIKGSMKQPLARRITTRNFCNPTSFVVNADYVKHRGN